MEKRSVMVGIAVVAAAAALLAWNRFGGGQAENGQPGSLSAAATAVMDKASSAVGSLGGATTPALPLPSDTPAAQRPESLPAAVAAAAASAAGLSVPNADALAKLQARMKQATANGRVPSSDEVVGYLNELERLLGSSQVFGIDLAAMRSNVELVSAMAKESEEILRLTKKTPRSDEDERELAQRKERLVDLQRRLRASAGTRTSAASAVQGAQ